MHGAARDGATTRRAARSMGVSFTMDALATMSSDEEEEEEEDEEEEDANARERSVVVRKRREIDYEALERGGFRARALVDGARDDGGASVGPTTWGKGIAGGRCEAYTAEESAATRRAVGEGLTETCAVALESARERARARAASEEERRLERAKSRERHLETKRALREDDRAKRAREAEARVNASGTPKSRRQKVDLSTRREEEEEEKTKGNDVDDESLVATGGFDFGD
jgi:hypothetical protein|tara:strand:+ start:255 stop:941 length:687 start_codon:yes stop_codon:yes gene_type:complete